MNEKKKHVVLEGHMRRGKRFVPPMKQLANLSSVSFVDDMLPELVWIALINERYGYGNGAEIIRTIFKAIDQIKTNEQHGNFALASCYKTLLDAQRNELTRKLEEAGVLERIRCSVAPLVLLYDECPIKFFGPPTTVFSETQFIDTIKNCVRKSIDRYKTPAIWLYGAMLIYRITTKTIHFSKDIKIPDLNSVITDPYGDEAKKAAGFLRAGGLSEFGMMGLDKSWANYFWNRNYQLSPCELI